MKSNYLTLYSQTAVMLRLVVFCLLTVVSILYPKCVSSQSETSGGLQSELEASTLAWLENLYAHGVEIKGDSVYFNDETRLITSDSQYYSLIYPEKYTWERVSGFLQLKMLKPAIWYMINLYGTDPERRDLVLKMILPLEQTLEMDRVLLAAFYTYIAFDPQVYRIENGKSVEVLRPDIAEQKLLSTKAITDAIFAQRLVAKK